MTSIDQLEQRLTTVERTLTDSSYDLDELSEMVDAVERLADLESRMERIESRLATIEGRTECVEAYMGDIESVNESVEQQADMAIASVDRLERRLVETEQLMDISTVKQLNSRIEGLEDEIQRLSGQQLGKSTKDEFETAVVGAVDEASETQAETNTQQVSDRRAEPSETADTTQSSKTTENTNSW